MRWIAMLGSIALVAGCLREETVDCGDGTFCPVGLACAAPGYCGDPAQVTSCIGAVDWDPCSFDGSDETSGSCRYGICGACDANREGCAKGWSAMVPPISPELLGVWVFDRANAIVVGTGGAVLHYDGTGWNPIITTPPIPTDLLLRSVWGTSVDDFYVVSDNATAQNLLRITNRNTLEFVTTGTLGLKAVWGTASDNAYVAGLGGAIRRFDGTSWELVQSGGPTYWSIHGASADRIFAVGGNGAFAKFEGGQWTTGTVPNVPTGEILKSVWVGTTDVFAVANARLVVRYDGADWDNAAMFDGVPPMVNLAGVWGSGAADYYVCGDDGAVARSTDAVTWKVATSSLGTTNLRWISGSSATNIFAVGTGGAIWRYSQ